MRLGLGLGLSHAIGGGGPTAPVFTPSLLTASYNQQPMALVGSCTEPSADRETEQCYGTLLSSVAYTVTGSSVSVGTPPSGSAIARLSAGEACYVSNNGRDASATNGIYLGAGDIADIQVFESMPIEAITA